MSKKNKQPKASFNPINKKEAKYKPQNEPDKIFDLNPVWQFEHIDFDGPYGWGKTNKEQIIDEILPKIKDFEKLTFKEILQDKQNKHHEINFADFSKEARNRLEEKGLHKIVDSFLSLRLEGDNRIFCLRKKHILKIVWWDPDHKVCPSLKKHT